MDTGKSKIDTWENAREQLCSHHEQEVYHEVHIRRPIGHRPANL
jgi:hypothetical protein